MKTAFSTTALTGTLALHAALVAAVVAGLSVRQDQTVERRAISVQLLPPAAAPPAPLPMAAAPEKPKPEPKRPPPPKRIARPKPAPKPREAPTREAQVPDKPVESKPAAPDTSALAAAPATTPVPATQAAPSAPAAPAGPPATPVTTGVSIPASYAATNRKPEYPALSRRYQEQGTVVLQVLVKADGTAGEVKLKSSSGHPLLDKSALGTVRSWRFAPATRDGKPVAEWYPVPITFTLQN